QVCEACFDVNRREGGARGGRRVSVEYVSETRTEQDVRRERVVQARQQPDVRWKKAAADGVAVVRPLLNTHVYSLAAGAREVRGRGGVDTLVAGGVAGCGPASIEDARFVRLGQRHYVEADGKTDPNSAKLGSVRLLRGFALAPAVRACAARAIVVAFTRFVGALLWRGAFVIRTRTARALAVLRTVFAVPLLLDACALGALPALALAVPFALLATALFLNVATGEVRRAIAPADVLGALLGRLLPWKT